MKCVGPTLSKEEIQMIREEIAYTPELDELAMLFNLSGNSTRLKILFLLYSMKELCVCDIAEMLDITVSAVSQHLAKMRPLGLVKTRRQNQTIYYSLSDHEFIRKLTPFLRQVELVERETIGGKG